MKTMTKNQFRKFAGLHGYEAKYSGKLRKFFIRPVMPMRIIDLHNLINSRA